jgi:hypothetical protein
VYNLTWYVAWAPTPSNVRLGEVYISPHLQLVVGEQTVVVGGTPDSPASQQCVNGATTVCLQWLVLTLTVTTSRYAHGLTGAPTVSQQYANGAPLSK